MEARDLDAVLVIGPGQHNPAMVYLIGGAHLTQAILLKKRGEEAVLFHMPMERDEAALTGLKTSSLGKYRITDLIKEYKGDVLRAFVKRTKMMLEDMNLTEGRIALYGNYDAGASYGLFSALSDALPKLKIIGEVGDSMLLQVRATKDETEVARIRHMGGITTSVVGKVAEYIGTHTVRNEMLVKKDGQPLTVGDIKSRINLWLAELGAENPEETIFAIGSEAGVPHTTGSPELPLRLGQTIVFDIFPCEAGGGYYYDFTRTWSLGYATDESLRLYEDVYAVYKQIMDELEANVHCPAYQERTCELFEAQGHTTIRTNPQTQEGYVHSLGHGIGLNVHERPYFGTSATGADRTDPGTVFTIEPGLYYPERGMGVRIEDTVWVRPNGQIEILAEYPYDFVLPVKGK
jgi:Xaa-Pro aminopeptidase